MALRVKASPHLKTSILRVKASILHLKASIHLKNAFIPREASTSQTSAEYAANNHNSR